MLGDGRATHHHMQGQLNSNSQIECWRNNLKTLFMHIKELPTSH